MRRLVMWNVQTLDGYFEGKAPWDLEFHEAAWGEELQQFSLDQLKEIGAVLYGRATYEGMASYWAKATGPTADAMNDLPKIVFSRTLDAAPTIRELRDEAEHVRAQTLQQAQRMLASGRDPQTVIEFLASTLTNRLLHMPSQRLRDAAQQRDAELITAARVLFALDTKPPAVNPLEPDELNETDGG